MVEDLRQQLERLVSGRLGTTHLRRPKRVPSQPIEELVGGEVRETPLGTCVIVDQIYPAGHQQGQVEISSALSHRSQTVVMPPRPTSAPRR